MGVVEWDSRESVEVTNDLDAFACLSDFRLANDMVQEAITSSLLAFKYVLTWYESIYHYLSLPSNIKSIAYLAK
jgi:hypothetical protein